jgi:hypothetical protein
MVSLVRQKRFLAGILTLLVAAPYEGFSQPAFEPSADDEQQKQIIDTIQREQSEKGPYSADLIGAFTALGLLYEERGLHDPAAMALKSAQGVVRVNYGLRSFDQAPLIEQLIRGEEARGNAAAVWDLEQELLNLVRQNPDDLRTVPILHEIADKRLDVLRRYDAGEEIPPQITLGCYYKVKTILADAGNCYSGSKSDAVRSILSEAQNYYAIAINALLKQKLYSSDELRELEMQLVRSSFQFGAPRTGRDSLRRLLAYEVANSEPWLSQIDALIQIADWDVLCDSNQTALKMYEVAYQQLEREGTAEASVEQRFSPKTPVVLPAFLPNPLVSDETRDSTGYIDAAFEITAYGTSRRVEILDTTTNATRAAKKRFVQMILRSRFRPMTTNGKFAETAPIVVRYYLKE